VTLPFPNPKLESLPQAEGVGGAGDGCSIEPWRVCYREMGAKLLLYARQFLQPEQFTLGQEAEDVVQTAFVRFWKLYPNAQSDQYGLLFSAVRTAAMDVLRSSLRRTKREDLYSVEVHDFRDTAAIQAGRDSWFVTASDQQAKADDIQEALQKIPAEQREVIVLKVWGELTFAQIATSLNESPNTVASRYRLGIKALKKELSAYGHAGF